VLSIALSAATRSDDAHPTDITMASGPLKTAEEVESPGASFGPGFPPNTNSTAYLVAMHGCFTYNGPQPPPRPGAEPPPCSTVLELVVNESGAIASQRWTSSTVVPLSNLGPVTQLQYPGEPASAEGASGQELSPAQVLKLALTAAARSDDPRPTNITMASGPLEIALEVENPGSSFGPGHPAEPGRVVTLVVMHGCFRYNGSEPAPTPGEPRGPAISTVREVIVGPGEPPSGGAWTMSVPVPLSRLGPVTQLHYPGEPRPARKHHGRASPPACRS
jgi:hypothetical protein